MIITENNSVLEEVFKSRPSLGVKVLVTALGEARLETRLGEMDEILESGSQGSDSRCGHTRPPPPRRLVLTFEPPSAGSAVTKHVHESLRFFLQVVQHRFPASIKIAPSATLSFSS